MTQITGLTARDIGTSSAATAATQPDASQELGQKDFLTLMAAQLQNQDPFAPMENGEFLAQMAQFSTVQGLDRVNGTLTQISGQIGGDRLATGAALMGKSVLVPGTLARPDDSGAIRGRIDLTEPSDALTVHFRDAQTGEVLHSEAMGAQPAGSVAFAWDDMPPALADARSAIRISAETTGAAPATPSVYARVVGVEMPEGRAETLLDLEDHGVMSSLEVTALR